MKTIIRSVWVCACLYGCGEMEATDAEIATVELESNVKGGGLTYNDRIGKLSGNHGGCTSFLACANGSAGEAIVMTANHCVSSSYHYYTDGNHSGWAEVVETGGSGWPSTNDWAMLYVEAYTGNSKSLYQHTTWGCTPNATGSVTSEKQCGKTIQNKWWTGTPMAAWAPMHINMFNTRIVWDHSMPGEEQDDCGGDSGSLMWVGGVGWCGIYTGSHEYAHIPSSLQVWCDSIGAG